MPLDGSVRGSVSTTSVARIGWPSLAKHPRFRSAVMLNAALILAQKDRLSPTIKWLTNDVGRASTLSRVLQLGGRRGLVSVGDVLDRARPRHIASRGRILQILRRSQTAGLLAIEDRAGSWSNRRITIQPLMLDLWRERAAAEIESAGFVIPEIRPALDRLVGDAFLLDFMGRLDRFDGMDLSLRGPPNPGFRCFMVREGGLSMLYDLLLRQPPAAAGEGLLTEAPFSRARLAARFSLSRTHVRRLFADAAEAGHVSFPTHDRIAFAPSMAEEAERHFALTFHVIGSIARSAMEARRRPRATAPDLSSLRR
jgi:hypothetical protein